MRQWSREHTALLARADPASYFVTHGEPGVHNQWPVNGRTYLIDGESLLVAPRERNLATLVHGGVATAANPHWLQGPHTGDADDLTALGELSEELTRPHFDE